MGAFGDARLPGRFWAKVQVVPSGCWEWKAAKYIEGYGAFRVGSMRDGTRRQVRAHRYAYEVLAGPIPDGLVLDHLCRVRSCVNPDHLEPVTDRENLLRGVGPTARHASTVHCPRGHPYEGDNLYVNPKSGRRSCRACHRQWDLERYYSNDKRRYRGEARRVFRRSSNPPEDDGG